MLIFKDKNYDTEESTKQKAVISYKIKQISRRRILLSLALNVFTTMTNHT